ncbi:hypothetical protein GGS24DRAFT_496058 [Hypoxylon argillaceum]|nr:hypothetical protein GGS24DRAFT_496058 [Hypoxylon argillaceum]KAI1155070.1 hypothetical protein F4825DRAFT_447971 [Nemania diffusa]
MKLKGKKDMAKSNGLGMHYPARRLATLLFAAHPIAVLWCAIPGLQGTGTREQGRGQM